MGNCSSSHDLDVEDEISHRNEVLKSEFQQMLNDHRDEIDGKFDNHKEEIDSKVDNHLQTTKEWVEGLEEQKERELHKIEAYDCVNESSKAKLAQQLNHRPNINPYAQTQVEEHEDQWTVDQIIIVREEFNSLYKELVKTEDIPLHAGERLQIKRIEDDALVVVQLDGKSTDLFVRVLEKDYPRVQSLRFKQDDLIEVVHKVIPAKCHGKLTHRKLVLGSQLRVIDVRQDILVVDDINDPLGEVFFEIKSDKFRYLQTVRWHTEEMIEVREQFQADRANYGYKKVMLSIGDALKVTEVGDEFIVVDRMENNKFSNNLLRINRDNYHLLQNVTWRQYEHLYVRENVEGVEDGKVPKPIELRQGDEIIVMVVNSSSIDVAMANNQSEQPTIRIQKQFYYKLYSLGEIRPPTQELTETEDSSELYQQIPAIIQASTPANQPPLQPTTLPKSISTSSKNDLINAVTEEASNAPAAKKLKKKKSKSGKRASLVQQRMGAWENHIETSKLKNQENEQQAKHLEALKTGNVQQKEELEQVNAKLNTKKKPKMMRKTTNAPINNPKRKAKPVPKKVTSSTTPKKVTSSTTPKKVPTTNQTVPKKVTTPATTKAAAPKKVATPASTKAAAPKKVATPASTKAAAPKKVATPASTKAAAPKKVNI